MADKFRILITGKHSVTIDSFFVQLSNDFDLISSSTRPGDQERHIQLCQPDIVVVCLAGETQEEMQRYRDLKAALNEIKAKLCAIGDSDEVTAFQNATHDLAYLELRRPATMTSMREAIMELLEKTQPERDEIKKQNAKAGGAKNAQKTPVKAETVASDPAKAYESLEDAKEAEIARRKHIMVVDDDPVMLKVIKETLKEDFDIATAVSGKLALNFLRSKKTDLIILDYEMPEMSGPDVLKALRTDSVTAQIPVLFLTGVTDQEKIKNALTYKPQGYIVKPVSGKILRDTIDNVISKLIENKFKKRSEQ